MVQPIITAFPTEKREARRDESPIINVAECFAKTIQGEGKTVGIPSTFLRVQHCTLSCVWCDTLEVWRKGNPYSAEELVELFEFEGVLDDFRNGHHLILTGGSPVKQQEGLCALVRLMHNRNVYPTVEIENECTLMPSRDLIDIVDVWNLSPKLANSGMKEKARYKPEVLQKLSSLSANPEDEITLCWKFVVSSEDEWQEINEYFVKPGFAKREDIVLMPEGQSREELQAHYDAVVNIAVREGLRVTDRMHVTVWDKKTGV